jgi:hypothetical protein
LPAPVVGTGEVEATECRVFRSSGCSSQFLFGDKLPDLLRFLFPR